MPFTLEIVVGGLCMFVKCVRPASRGLYVLMPRMEMEGAVHVPLLYHPGRGTEAPTTMRLDGRVVDLQSLDVVPGETTIPPGFAAVSAYAGGKRVRRACMAPAGPGGLDPTARLAARIDLPPGGRIEPFGAVARVNVERDGHEEPRDLYGRARILHRVVDGDGVTIDGRTFEPHGGRLVLGFFNITEAEFPLLPRMNDAGLPVPEPPPGTPLAHFGAYYSLIEGCDTGHHGPPCGPVPRSRRNGSAGNGRKSEVGVQFVDPYRCTLGSGCDPDVPDDCPE